MKKSLKHFTSLLLLGLSIAPLMACGNSQAQSSVIETSQSQEMIDYGTLTIEDITIEEGKEISITPIFSIPDKQEEITYSFEGNNISITDGVVKGLRGGTETIVTAKTSHLETTFKVKVAIDYGTLSFLDLTLSFGQEQVLNPVFSKEEYADNITYTFEGSNISITDGLIKGLIPDTETIVTAKTTHHETTFKVKVEYISAVLQDAAGNESKFAIPTPNADNYLLKCDVDIETYRTNGWTRLTAFAFNGSDNSWYNIEMNADGNVMLYARFNGVEKYHINLFNINDDGIIINNKIHYTVSLLKVGQETKLFINEKIVCAFFEDELQGYAALGSLEVTACANRADAGEYKVNLSKLYYELENGEEYNKYFNYEGSSVVEYNDVTLEAADGAERKYSLGDLSIVFGNSYLFKTKVLVNNYDGGVSRISSFAFNSSDNSWYNIEINEVGNVNLYGRFNGVEKYGIYLFNKNDESVKVGDKFQYEIALLKKNQNTFFFVNDKLVCSFNENELSGYARLSTLEFTCSTDASWRDGGPYSVSFSSISVSNSTTEIFETYNSLTQA